MIEEQDMKTYSLQMSDGNQIDIRSTSAADAMQKALEMRRGLKVKSCWLGDKHRRDRGYIDFEVPSHSALSESAPSANPRREKRDAPCEMFDDATIKADSDRARALMARGPL